MLVHTTITLLRIRNTLKNTKRLKNTLESSYGLAPLYWMAVQMCNYIHADDVSCSRHKQ